MARTITTFEGNRKTTIELTGIKSVRKRIGESMESFLHLNEIHEMKDWFDSLVPSERKFADDFQEILIPVDVHPDFSGHVMTVSQYLEGVACSAKDIDPEFARKTILFALSLPSSPVDRHFLYNRLVEFDKLDPRSASLSDIERAIDYCKLDVAALPQVKSEWKQKFGELFISHPPLDKLIELLDYLERQEEAVCYREIRKRFDLDPEDHLPEYVIEYRRRMEQLERDITDFVSMHPGCLQTDVYPALPDFRKYEIQTVLRNHPNLKRERVGRTYTLTVTDLG